MAKRPYFSVSRDSFEKNAGYKTTVHALSELVDNAVEAEANTIMVIIMVNDNGQLSKIAVVDNGSGMAPVLVQQAICEKAGSNLARQRGGGSPSRRKLGKYGVGLPKASISQCNKFTVWSWCAGGPATASMNGIDITDSSWIDGGAHVEESIPQEAPQEWLMAAELADSESGTLVVWEKLDGVTWSRARWGQHSGLIPNLEFELGRVYRKMIGGEAPELLIGTSIINEHFQAIEPPTPIKPNDPLFLEPGQVIPKEKLDDGTLWPTDDPIFDEFELPESTMRIALHLQGEEREVTVGWRASLARKDVFAKLNNRDAGSLKHGQFAKRSVGLSLLREGREISMSQALSNPSEPRERWFGVEVDFPHELDVILGMTNNKQEYTRFERVLRNPPEEYMLEGESTQACLDRIAKEDPQLALCLRIAWQTQTNWKKTKKRHLGMRPSSIGTQPQESSDDPPEPVTPEDAAELAASSADPDLDSSPKTEKERRDTQAEIREKLINDGVPKPEAEQIAARIIERGLTYAIANRSGLGTPFFNVNAIKNKTKLIELNEDHPVHRFLRSSIGETSDTDESDPEALRKQLTDARTAMLLILEAWASIEGQAFDQEKRKFLRIREDWGRKLEDFVDQLLRDRE